MNIIKYYTYLLKFKLTNQYYYGSRIKNVRLGRTPSEDLKHKYITSSNKIKQLIEQHGIDAFEWEIRKTFNTAQEAVVWERRLLTRCNILKNPDKWLNGNVAGHILSTPESRKKISEYHTGKPKSEEHKRKLSESNTGIKKRARTTEEKQKMSNVTKGENNPRFGVVVDNETRKKISEATKGKSKTSRKPMTEEQKQHLSKVMSGKTLSEEHKKKVGEATRKRGARNEETKRKIAEALRGKAKGPMSAEEKAKRSVALKGKPKSKDTTNKKTETLKQLVAEGKHHSMLKLICPHCGTSVNKLLYARWHGDNCKQAK